MNLNDAKIAIIGLGYVGLPLAVAFGKEFETMGLDTNAARIGQLRAGIDVTLETESRELEEASLLSFTTELDDIRNCNVYIVTVPTPIDCHKRPDLTPLINASETVGKVISKGDIIIYESTVYPGATEEDCIPIVERASGLTLNLDFFAGYSPERINPGDKNHRLATIVKITSGSNDKAAWFVNELYKKIITAGTYLAPSIKVAEAAKVIENTQRDVNIALINELSLIFEKLEIDTLSVLEAAGTKWNFLPFRPGLVGGHCIGVDPYYLTHKAQEVGYLPEIVLAGRRINDRMGSYIVERLVRNMIKGDIKIKDSRVLILGLAFKENCPDLRNTRVIDIISALEGYGINVDVFDPWVDPNEAYKEYQIDMLVAPEHDQYDGIIIAVAHSDFLEAGPETIRKYGKDNCQIFDIKGLFDASDVDDRL